MSTPSRKEMLEHLQIHYGLTLSETMQFVNIPHHPFEMRDEFARAALPAIIATAATSHFRQDKPEHIARNAYEIADAMLSARIKNEHQE